MNFVRSLLIGILVQFGALAIAADPLSYGFTKIWTGNYTPGGFLPLRVELENTGPGETVELITRSSTLQLVTPVEMPKGSTKSVELYIQAENWEPPKFYVKRGLLETQVDVPQQFAGPYRIHRVALISDNLSDLLMLRRPEPKESAIKDSNRFTVEDMVVKPGEAPTRTIGYSGINQLLLGEGAERLTDPEVEAIKGAVLGGMELIFVGGAIQPILADPRWRSLLPARVGSAQVEPLSKSLGPFGLKADFSLSKLGLDPLPLADAYPADAPILVRRRYGAGRISMLAIDPFDRKFKSWSQNRDFFTRFRDLNKANKVEAPEAEHAPSGTVFSVRMPSWTKIAAVLLGYLILVAPVNYLVLRKLRRGELAWITAPIISLGCAAIIFGFASELYRSEAARALSGIVRGGTGMDLMYFQGTQQLYFPSGGHYDLRLQGVQGIYGDADSSMRMNQAPLIQFYDVGEIVAPQFEVGNLAFREFFLFQSLPIDPRFATARLSESGRKATVMVRNTFDFPLSDVFVRVGIKRVRVGQIAPGDVATVDVELTDDEPLRLAAGLDASIFAGQYGSVVGPKSVPLDYTIFMEGQ